MKEKLRKGFFPISLKVDFDAKALRHDRDAADFAQCEKRREELFREVQLFLGS